MQETEPEAELYKVHGSPPGPVGKFAIYSEVPNDPNKRIYFCPTTPEQSGQPRNNQILGYELPSSDWDLDENFAFKQGSSPLVEIIDNASHN